MKREEIAKILSADPVRGVARVRSRQKRESRNAARKAGVALSTQRRRKFKEAVEKTFSVLQQSTVRGNR